MDRISGPERRLQGHGTVLALSLAALLLVLALAGGCGAPEPDARGFVLVGLDAADWSVADSLVAAGRMPHLRSVMDRGASGTLMSYVPLQKSPVIWSSVATGLEPGAHGIGGFPGEGAKGGRGARRGTKTSDWSAPAFWDIAAAAGLRSAVLGWWITFPAREIAGVMVSDHQTYAYDSCWRSEMGMVRPDSLREALAGLRVDPMQIELSELDRFLDLEVLAGREEAYAKELGELKAVYAADVTYARQAVWLAEHGSYDIFVVYFRGLDLIGHRFWRYYEPAKVVGGVDPEAVAILGRILPEYYAFSDELLGRVLAALPDEETVAVMSDHGFYGPRYEGNRVMRGVAEHRPQGIIALRSPLHEAGARFDRMDIRDVTPTLLALAGLPPSAEMSGGIFTGGMNGGGLKRVERLEAELIESYAPLRPHVGPEDSVGTDPELEDAVRRQLESLGYI